MMEMNTLKINMITVMAFGTFDGLHDGHKYLFQQASTLGDTLVVVVARDETVQTIKGNKPKFHEKDRYNEVKNCKYVNRAILGNHDDPYAVIEEHAPDVIALGYDQKGFATALPNIMSKRNLTGRIVRISGYKPTIYKSSILNNL